MTLHTPWAQLAVRQRLAVVRRARGLIAEHALRLAETVERDAADTLVAEILPLAEACRFLEREAESLLAPRRVEEGRPMWLGGVDLEIHREPLGVVLVIGSANYPILLPGVHVIQALTAGNSVLLKPGTGGSASMKLFVQLLIEAGLPAEALTLLGEPPEEAQAAIAAGVDKVILTGSNGTGQAVMRSLADSVTPSVMELSGCDAVFVREDADVDLAAKAIRFGLTLNGGNTCIAPKRVYVAKLRAADLEQRLKGLRIPVESVETDSDAIERAGACGYGLGASIFSRDERSAREMAQRIRSGVVVINDMIVPTADPRLPFGGRGKSGFGVTRGAEGLLEMTALKAITVRRGKWRPHFEEKHTSDKDLFQGFVAALHAQSWRRRLQGFAQMSRAAMARRKAA